MKRMKKLLALALSGVMALSCTVLAGATDASDYTGGTETGTGVFESILPDGRVRIVLPTFAPGAYNMILDPHSLIKQTGAARYTTGAAAPAFEGAASEEESEQVYLFFHNSDADAEYDYSSKSDTADVVNKSSFDVDVKVSVEMEKGLAGSAFEMVGKDAVATAEGAAMYLGLEVVDVESTTDTSAGTDTVEVASDATPQEVAVTLADDAEQVGAAPTVTVTGTSVGSATGDADKLKAKEIIGDISVVFNAGATAADKAEVIAALTDSRAARTADSSATPPVTALSAVTAASIAIAYTASSGSLTLTTTIPTKTTDSDFIPETYTAAATTVKVDGTDSTTPFDPTKAEHYTDAYFSIPVNKDVTVGTTTVTRTIAKIRGKVSGSKAFAAGDDAVASAAFTKSTAKVAPLSSATYSDTLDAYSSAYANVFKATAVGAQTGEYVLAYYNETSVQYNNQQATDTLTDLAGTLEPAKGLRFNLVGAINPSDDWDKLDGAENNIDIAVIWDVSEASARAKLPTLSVDTPATGSASNVTLKWTAGTGKYAGYAPKIGAGGAKYSKNGTATNLTTANGTTSDTFKVNGVGSSVRTNATNTNFVVVFSCTDKDDIEVAFPTGWYS